jgi:uncharacterized membrane protein YeaQ/YmgE (transglycosylase-associated protein family)
MNSPSTVQAVVIGLCLGAIYGLFFYQNYRRQFFWVFSLGVGIISGLAANFAVRQFDLWADSYMLAAFFQLAIPSVCVIFANRALAKNRRKRRTTGELSEVIPTHSFTSFL